MQIHYFQRYHQKENVSTANTMLLLSRLYSYSSNKFFKLLREFLPEDAEVELKFTMQEKSKESVPDAIIAQDSFKIVVETKPYSGNLDINQLQRHLSAFGNEVFKVLLTLSTSEIDGVLLKQINEHIKNNHLQIIHKHITFEWLLTAVREVLDDRDYEMLSVLEDYSKFCYESDLIPNKWKWMVVRSVGTTREINMRLNLYYDGYNVGKMKGYDYLGLYNQKSVFAIGKILLRVEAVKKIDGTIDYSCDQKEEKLLTQDVKNRIAEAMEDGAKYDYNLEKEHHIYYIVEKFVETDFQKTSKKGLFGSKVFDLTEYILNMNKRTSLAEIASALKGLSWQ